MKRVKLSRGRMGVQNARGTVILSFLLLGFSVNASAEPPQHSTNNEQAEKTVSLNLRDVDIGAFIDKVAEINKLNIVVDPRVKARVSIYSTSPFDSKQLYDAFLSILEVHNLDVIDIDASSIMILPKNAIILDKSVQSWRSASKRFPIAVNSESRDQPFGL